MEDLIYKQGDKYSAIPDPFNDITTVYAEKFLQVYDEPLTLEGACFDRNGNFYFTSTAGNTIFRVDMDTLKTSIIFHEEGIRPAAVKIHKNGRLFACCLTNEAIGGVISMDPDGSNREYIIKGYSVDDLVFDNKGGFYFTDFIGDFRNPLGGVYYVTPDYKKVTLFCGNMCQPNGVALSKDGSILWVTEFQAQRLHRFDLNANRASIPYRFTGMSGCDSCSIDDDDNLYVALPGQGRILIFNYQGTPIGQVLTPGREKGHHLFTTHPMVRPGKKELYITCKDTAPDSEGSWIFKSSSYAAGNTKAYQFS